MKTNRIIIVFLFAICCIYVGTWIESTKYEPPQYKLNLSKFEIQFNRCLDIAHKKDCVIYAKEKSMACVNCNN
jgi:hypothetical protein